MIAVLKPDTTKEQKEHLKEWLKSQHVEVHESVGKEYTVLGLVGNTGNIDVELVESLSMVDSVKRVSEPFKKSNRQFHPDDTVINIGKAAIGDHSCTIFAGLGVIEDAHELKAAAESAKAAGADILRCDASRKQFSPYDTEEMAVDNISLLLEAKRETGLPVSAEIADPRDIARCEDVDIIEVGTRNMQNYELLRELGKLKKPIILRRGLSSSLRELLMSAEYIMAGGNEQVILCERGIRTFETYTKNTLDVSAVPMLHELSHLPVITDPGSACGRSGLVEALSLASLAAGACGIVVDVCEDPLQARYNGAQSLNFAQLRDLTSKLKRIREVL